MNLNTYTDLVSFDTSEKERIKVLDSDEQYVDYFVDTEEGREAAEDLAYGIRLANIEEEIALCVYHAFCDVLGLYITHDEETVEELTRRYGKEYINRIGNCYLRIAE